MSAREARAFVASMPGPKRPAGVDVADRTIPGPAGELTIRVYRPSGAGETPAVMYFHGGGWVTGGLDSSDALVAALCRASGCTWIAVDYRLAPEAKFPAGLDDCLAATAWVADHGPELQVLGNRLAVAGDSAGGNLAATVALLAKDHGPQIDFQLLVYPVLDTDFDRQSYIDNGAFGLDAESMQWFLDQYVASANEATDWRVAPLRAPFLAGLPATRIVLAEYDALRDEAQAYADRLGSSGVDVEVQQEDGMVHGFWLLPVSRSRTSLTEAALAVKRALVRAEGATMAQAKNTSGAHTRSI